MREKGDRCKHIRRSAIKEKGSDKKKKRNPNQRKRERKRWGWLVLCLSSEKKFDLLSTQFFCALWGNEECYIDSEEDWGWFSPSFPYTMGLLNAPFFISPFAPRFIGVFPLFVDFYLWTITFFKYKK